MAHLVQGAEASILRAAFRLRLEKVVLLVRDGLISTRKLDTTLLEAKVLRETGYRMTFDEEHLEHLPDFDL